MQAVCDRYSGASFDGMTDMKEYHDSIVVDENGPQVVHFGADFIFANRDISDEFYAEFAAALSEFTGEPEDFSDRGRSEGWNKRYPVAVCHHEFMPEVYGQFARDSHQGEYGSTLAHQWIGCRVG